MRTNQEIFYSLKEAQVVVEQWRNEYNTIRPHSSPGYRPPAPQTSTGYQPNLVIWNASSPHIEERSEFRHKRSPLFRADCAEDLVGGGALLVGRSCPTSGHASNDKCSANISSLDNLGIKSPRTAIIRGRMNDT